MTVIVDASVAPKWVLTEDGTDRARALITQSPLAAPDLLWIECTNVLWVKARRGQITAQDARAACAAIAGTPIRVVRAEPLVADALDIALELKHAAYDCLYLAAALAERCVLVTADATFATKAAEQVRFAGTVRLL